MSQILSHIKVKDGKVQALERRRPQLFYHYTREVCNKYGESSERNVPARSSYALYESAELNRQIGFFPSLDWVCYERDVKLNL